MSESARLVFAGSPAFAVPTLDMLVARGHAPVAVLTQPDRPAGRGRALQPCPVRVAADHHGIAVLQPASLKGAAAQAEVRALAPTLIIVVAYGLLLPPEILGLPPRGCVNVHASLLPRWRGASPIQAAIAAGDAETGVSIMAMAQGLDTGPVYGMCRTPIGANETAGELEARLAVLGATALGEHLDALLAGTLRAVPQPAEGVTYAGRIHKNDARIDWREAAAAIARRVRAWQPWPVAETRLDGVQLRCHAATVVGEAAAPGDGVHPGQVIAAGPDGIDVATGHGVLRLTRVQVPGRNAVAAADFARGRTLAGKVLGA